MGQKLTDDEIEDLIIYEGLNSKKEFSVIVGNLETDAEILYKIYPQIVNVYPEDGYIKCDGCQTIVPIEDSTLSDGELFCSNCI